jgi:hypothetical protein
MARWNRTWKMAAAIIMGVATIPGAIVVMQAPVAGADVCVNAGRRVSVSGCASVADAIADYAPPPAYYAPMPEDGAEETAAPPPPPPPPAPNVSVCANVGRRVSVSGCI